MDNLKMYLLLLIIFISGISCTVTNKYGPYHGKVVDMETKQPIEGAAVLVVFLKESYSAGGTNYNYVDALETVTNENGEFKISSHRVASIGVLKGWDNYGHFTIFKPGYGCYPYHKNVKPMLIPGGTLPAEQYVVVELPKLETKEARIDNTDCFPLSIPDEKMANLIELNNVERISLGLQPTHTEKKKK